MTAVNAAGKSDHRSLSNEDLKAPSLKCTTDAKISKSLVNLKSAVKQTEEVNHPNSVPESDHYEQKQVYDPKGKPPIGLSQSDVHGNRFKPTGGRNSESHDPKCRGSVGSVHSYEEEAVLTYNDEAVNISDSGGGNDSQPRHWPVRLLIVSSKIRNTNAMRHALMPNVVNVQYKYDSATLDGILSNVSNALAGKKAESIALVLTCSGLSIQLCGKEEKLEVLTKENVSENQSVRDFFSQLVTDHLDLGNPGYRLDFLACNLMLHTDGGGIDKEIEACTGVPVKMYKDLIGNDTPIPKDEATKSVSSVGELYFRLDKLRGWSGQQQQTLAGFEKIQTVGKGAYGAAVLYKKKDDDSLVILKEINMHDLKAAERQMALNEVNILAMLEHPNIISYYDSFEEDGVIMIEMEYADGGTLAQFLAQKEKPLEEKDIVSMFQQIVAAIRHIHEHNILHRDLKTANIFLTKEGVVKIGDFGISKMMSTANKGANTVLGTPYYISPEMCEGKPYNDKSDIWALGCILYELACLQKTFEGSNLPALVNKIMKGQFAPVKGNYSQEFKDLIMEMLSQNPEKRPSANELMYSRLPALMSQYEDPMSDYEDDMTVSAGPSKKKTRSVLYYFDSATAILTPIELNSSKIKIRTVAVGEDHLIIVTTESQVFTWGDGSKGQLGHGDTESRAKPEIVEALKGKSIIRACCSTGFSVFASDRGIVLTCGDGSQGCLGHADFSSTYRPRLIESLLSVDVIAGACGPQHVAVVGSEGEVFTWGNGADGKLGLGNEENYCQPMRVTISEPVLIRDVFCGVDGTMFLSDVGSMFACGRNTDNKLGLNNRCGFIMAMRNIFTRTEVEGQKVPTLVRHIRHKVLDISMGSKHTAVIVEPGRVYTFGRNTEGQLGIGSTKAVSMPFEVKSMPESMVNRVQCGEHYTVASTDNNELYYWGLRFKSPSTAPPVDESEGRSSNSGTLNKDDMRIESVTPRASASHSRQASLTSVTSIASTKDSFYLNDGEVSSMTDKETDSVNRSPQRQVSVDSNASAFTDSGYTGDNMALSETTMRSGFRPLSSVPRRTASASSRENAKEKEKDHESNKEIIFPPNHLMKIMKSGAESLTISSFFSHGENIFIQLETTAPPPRRRSRKKRGIRKRFSGNTLPVPGYTHTTSASSREGGDEYSSETSEMDTQGTVPTWIKQELELSKEEVNDGFEADDTSDPSDNDLKHGMIDTSMSSIQINHELTPCKVPPDKKPSPRSVKPKQKEPALNETKVETVTPRDVRVRSLSNNSTESEMDNAASDSSSKDLRLGRLGQSGKELGDGRKAFSARQRVTGAPSHRTKSATSASQRQPNRYRPQTRGYVGHDLALKENLAARGFVSDVTVKRREDALLGELHMTREEKQKAEKRLKELEEEHRQQQEKLTREAEQRAMERESQLQEQIQLLKQELQTQNSQLQNNQKVVSQLQEQLNRVQKKKYGRSTPSSAKESRVCVLQ